ncbi:DUF3438 family protein [Thiomicrorhabdus indica]|uniref:DUF3438 family protein n=1 Tax=Thiomicrorhabdus indica TaxID=2267253 RepID=UPI00102D7FB0|nr:DUF3438 family protein [Thiomicrorhabdus indica]
MKILLGLVLMCVSQLIAADEHVVFEGEPITVSVSDASERQLVFPKGSVIVTGVTLSQKRSFKTLSSVDNRVFVQLVNSENSEDVGISESLRVLFKDKLSGQNFVVYFQKADEDQVLDKVVNIHLPKKNAESISQAQTQSNTSKVNSYPFLTKYVFQQVYSPTRLVKTHPNIQRVGVEEHPVKDLFGCYEGNLACVSIESKPLVSFRTDKLYASAIRVRNTSSEPIELDTRMIQRNSKELLAATLMHHRLLPVSQKDKAETVMVLIHKRPLREFFYEYQGGIQ